MNHRSPTSLAKPTVLEIHIERTRCPACLSTNVKVYGTIDQGDGSLLRYTRCRACATKFRVIAE
jgi:transposase-like protein